MSSSRKVVLQVSVLSVDGYICEGGTAFDSLADEMVDDVRDAWMVDSLWRAGVHIMGGTTYRSMASYWPDSTEVFAEVMNRLPKVAFSRSLRSDEVTWGDSSIAAGDTAAELDALRRDGAGEIIAHGGAKFAQYLATNGLVDEYRLIVYPIVAGGGTRLFHALDGPRRVRLVSTTPFPNGCVAAVYTTID